MTPTERQAREDVRWGRLSQLMDGDAEQHQQLVGMLLGDYIRGDVSFYAYNQGKAALDQLLETFCNDPAVSR